MSRHFVHPNDLLPEPWEAQDPGDEPIEVFTGTVYVLVPEAVYGHGVIGVYATEEDALAAAEKVWLQTDGHHTLVIHPREIGTTHDEVFQKTHYGHKPPPEGEPRIEIQTEVEDRS